MVAQFFNTVVTYSTVLYRPVLIAHAQILSSRRTAVAAHYIWMTKDKHPEAGSLDIFTLQYWAILSVLTDSHI